MLLSGVEFSLKIRCKVFDFLFARIIFNNLFNKLMQMIVEGFPFAIGLVDVLFFVKVVI